MAMPSKCFLDPNSPDFYYFCHFQTGGSDNSGNSRKIWIDTGYSNGLIEIWDSSLLHEKLNIVDYSFQNDKYECDNNNNNSYNNEVSLMEYDHAIVSL